MLDREEAAKNVGIAMILLLAMKGLYSLLAVSLEENVRPILDAKICERKAEEALANSAQLGIHFVNRDFPEGTTDINKVGKGWYTFKHYGQCMLLYDMPGATGITPIKECADGSS